MKVLVVCEFSGKVRDAFIAKGHNAMSCDLLPTEAPGPHFQGDAFEAIASDAWDLLIAHPPCTHLAVSGAAWFPAKRADGRQQAALEFVRRLLATPVPRIALENPVSIISTHIREPDQVIHPWQFGHSTMKATCLWLKNLPWLVPTNIVGRGEVIVHPSGKRSSRWSMDTFKLPPNLRAHERSKTFAGIAAAMADQWGDPSRLPELQMELTL